MPTMNEAITFQIANNYGIDEQKTANVYQHVIRTVKTLELSGNMNSESQIRMLPKYPYQSFSQASKFSFEYKTFWETK